MGFLQRFTEDQPEVWKAMKHFNGETFSIVGGGMTSPDKYHSSICDVTLRGIHMIHNIVCCLMVRRSSATTCRECASSRVKTYRGAARYSHSCYKCVISVLVSNMNDLVVGVVT